MLRRSKTSIFVLIVLFALVVSGCSGGGTDPSNQEKVQNIVDADWAQYQQAHNLPVGGIAVYVETPTGNYFAASGMSAGVDRDTRLRIASITKTFTSAAIMLLAQQGKLNLDDTIVSNIPGQGIPYVPNAAQYNIPNKAAITIRHLLSHTAGVFDNDNDAIPSTCVGQAYAGQSYPLYILEGDPNHQFSPDEFVSVNAACNLSYFAPGAGYHYSDTGYVMLATIIERVSGLPYDRFLAQNLLAPNGLSSTLVNMLGTDQTIPPPFIPGYEYYQGEFEDMTAVNGSMHIGEGNIVSTPADLARWAKRLIRGEAGLNSASANTMITLTPQSIQAGKNYGLGIQHTSGLGYGHTGAVQGYLSLMMYDPAAEVTTIVYFNVWDFANMFGDQYALLLQAGRDARHVLGY